MVWHPIVLVAQADFWVKANMHIIQENNGMNQRKRFGLKLAMTHMKSALPNV
jgi:hypothetical protein